MTQHIPECHVVSHVHWDREWYRMSTDFRARLLELAERLADDLDAGRFARFNLDGQTIILDDIRTVRPDLVERLMAHIRDGRLTIGPWHTLADNQLVSAENLVRNLFLARDRVGTHATEVGYSPDAFGHPADLPRILRGFGITTAVVWRGAPPELGIFRWRSADGSEVLTVNQAYHQAEILWDADDAADALRAYLERWAERAPAGPWYLPNGGDHLYPVPPSERAEAFTAVADLATMRETSLPDFFADLDPEFHWPVVDGELRHPGDRLTFLLPGTLSARPDVKQINARAETMLERFVEPLLAVAPARFATTYRALTARCWEAVVANAAHDSICGCSIDSVHRSTNHRAEEVLVTAEQIVRRYALEAGCDTRGQGKPATDAVAILVRSCDGDRSSMPVELEIVTAEGRAVVALLAPDGTEIPFEATVLGPATWFEADLDLLPDTCHGTAHRLAFRAENLPPFGDAVWTAVLGDVPAAEATVAPGRSFTLDGRTVELADDASVTVTDATGRWEGLGLLVDELDRGDTYNFDPVPGAEEQQLHVVDALVKTSAVRSTLLVQAVFELPAGLADTREGPAEERVELPVNLCIEAWAGDPVLRWHIQWDNTARDHRLRWLAASPASAETWEGDTHWSVQHRSIGPAIGDLPKEVAHEAAIGTSPTHTFARIATPGAELAVLQHALPEVQGLDREGTPTLAVTLLRSVGWLSRFDLRSRTTGAGPQFAVDDAQMLGPGSARIGLLLGNDAADPYDVAHCALLEAHRVYAVQLRTVPERTASPELAPRVAGALVSALKPTVDGDGLALRIWNPTGQSRPAHITWPEHLTFTGWSRLDETPLKPQPDDATVDGDTLTVVLAPWAVRTLRFVHT